MSTKLAVVGTDHAHVVELTQQLVAAGAQVAAIVATDDGIGPWLATQYPRRARRRPVRRRRRHRRHRRDSERTRAIAVRAMRAGKDVVLDKPGVTTLEQLAEIRRVQAETGRRWLVVFGERLGNPAMLARAATRRRRPDRRRCCTPSGSGRTAST